MSQTYLHTLSPASIRSRFVCLRLNTIMLFLSCQNFNTKHLDLWQLHQNYKTSFSIDGPLPEDTSVCFVFGNWTLTHLLRASSFATFFVIVVVFVATGKNKYLIPLYCQVPHFTFNKFDVFVSIRL